MKMRRKIEVTRNVLNSIFFTKVGIGNAVISVISGFGIQTRLACACYWPLSLICVAF